VNRRFSNASVRKVLGRRVHEYVQSNNLLYFDDFALSSCSAFILISTPMVYGKILYNNIKEYTPKWFPTIPYSQTTKPVFGKFGPIQVDNLS
jgi:hypothetical protein